MPNVLQTALDCERFGAQGITVHPRPDERHIRYADVRELKANISTEFNIEGYPNPAFIELVSEVRPAQVTLVPDAPDAITSNAGWDTIKHHSMLSNLVQHFHQLGIRTSLFVETDTAMIEGAARTGTQRVELYTEAYAQGYAHNKAQAIAPFVAAAKVAQNLGLELNAGHDLNSDNLRYFAQEVPGLLEVSIGHALISEALYLGLENTIQLYLNQLRHLS